MRPFRWKYPYSRTSVTTRYRSCSCRPSVVFVVFVAMVAPPRFGVTSGLSIQATAWGSRRFRSPLPRRQGEPRVMRRAPGVLHGVCHVLVAARLPHLRQGVVADDRPPAGRLLRVEHRVLDVAGAPRAVPTRLVPLRVLLVGHALASHRVPPWGSGAASVTMPVSRGSSSRSRRQATVRFVWTAAHTVCRAEASSRSVVRCTPPRVTVTRYIGVVVVCSAISVGPSSRPVNSGDGEPPPRGPPFLGPPPQKASSSFRSPPTATGWGMRGASPAGAWAAGLGVTLPAWGPLGRGATGRGTLDPPSPPFASPGAAWAAGGPSWATASTWAAARASAALRPRSRPRSRACISVSRSRASAETPDAWTWLTASAAASRPASSRQ